MAIVTGSMYKGFTFGGISSKDYGVYISGDGVFNAPEKDVEMISIPGRSGSFALDHGRWLNIELAYPAGLFGSDETDFAQAISDLRNALASKKGYQILEDDYHPGEFRQAIYHSGLEVTPAQLKAGEFTITFDCKPQRWLTAGQNPVSITSGDEITNPTLFDASPLLLVEGYGNINLGDDQITIERRTIGDVLLASAATTSKAAITVQAVRTFSNTSQLAVNDITYNTGALNPSTDQIEGKPDIYTVTLSNIVVTQSTNVVWVSGGFDEGDQQGVITRNTAAGTLSITLKRCPGDWAFGDADTRTYPFVYRVTIPSGTYTLNINISITYNGTNKMTWRMQCAGTIFTSGGAYIQNNSITTGEYHGDSSIITTGNPMYIDLDIGEAYKYDGDDIVSVNSAVLLGANLPVLPPGDTEITYDNTITSLQIVPRYWKL